MNKCVKQGGEVIPSNLLTALEFSRPKNGSFYPKKRHLSAYSHCHYLGLMVGSKLLTFLLPIDAFVTILKRPDFTLNLLKYEFKRDGFFAWFHFDKKKLDSMVQGSKITLKGELTYCEKYQNFSIAPVFSMPRRIHHHNCIS